MMRIAVLAPFYVPAHRAGGPIPGIQGVLATLPGDEIHVVTGDRDLGQSQPYPEPYRGTIRLDGVRVSYLPPLSLTCGRQWLAAIRVLAGSDVCYLNSLHSAAFTILPLFALRAAGYRGVIVVSPRGELAQSARELGRRGVKRAWSGFLRLAGWDRRLGRGAPVAWLASSLREEEDILNVFPRAHVGISPERLRPTLATPSVRAPHDPLRVIVVGRLAPVKGTLDLVRALAHVTRPVRVEFIGPEEDAAYVAQLRAAEQEKAAVAACVWTGPLAAPELMARVREADLLVSLTRGENFGHAIGEALRDGCPVLISDRTPWTDIVAAGAGKVLTDDECRRPEVVARALDALAALGKKEFEEMSQLAARAGAQGPDVPGSVGLTELVREVAPGRGVTPPGPRRPTR